MMDRLVVMALLLIPRIGQVHSLLVNMSRFNSLIEPETCTKVVKWLNYEKIGSLFMWDQDLHLFYDDKIDKPFKLRYTLGVDYQTRPIYGIQFQNNSTEREYYDLNAVVFNHYLINYNVTYYNQLDKTIVLFVLDGPDAHKDVMIPYNVYKKNNQTFLTPFQMEMIDKGTIPLMHWHEGDSMFLEPNMAMSTTLISNSKYSYQSAFFVIHPIRIRVEQTYYYGFNQNLSRIYFAKKFKLFETIPDFLHPKNVIGSKRWHPFRCFSYIYLMVDEWVFIFPHLNLTQQLPLLNNSPILQASISVMHRNTFFRCSNGNNVTVPIPTYPNMKITVYGDNSIDEIESTHKGTLTTIYFFWILVVVALFLITLIFVISCIVSIVRRLKKSNRTKQKLHIKTIRKQSSPSRSNSKNSVKTKTVVRKPEQSQGSLSTATITTTTKN